MVVAGYKTKSCRMFPAKGLRGVDVTKMSMSEWAAFRTSTFKIGGSDIGTVMGHNSFTDPLTLWYEKIGIKPKHFAGNIFTATGHLYEEIIMQQAEHYDETGEWAANFYSGAKFRRIKIVPYTLFHKDFPYFGLNLDGRVVQDHEYSDVYGTGVWECKTIGGHYAEKFVGGYPEKYNDQVQGYMMVTGAKYAVLTLVKDGRHVIQRTIFPDLEYQKEIDHRCTRFYEAMIKGKEVVDRKGLSISDKMDNLWSIQNEYADVLEIYADEELAPFLKATHEENDNRVEAQDWVANEKVYYNGTEYTLGELVEKRMEVTDLFNEMKGEKTAIDKVFRNYMTAQGYTKFPIGEYNVNFKSRFMVNKAKRNLTAS